MNSDKAEHLFLAFSYLLFTDWYTITATVAVVFAGFFTLIIVCALSCYRNRHTTDWSASNILCSESGDGIRQTASGKRSVIVASPFARPGVEYSSPQSDPEPSPKTSTGDVGRIEDNNPGGYEACVTFGSAAGEVNAIIAEDRSEIDCRCANEAPETAGNDTTLALSSASSIVFGSANSPTGLPTSAADQGAETSEKSKHLNRKIASETNNNETIYSDVEPFRNLTTRLQSK